MPHLAGTATANVIRTLHGQPQVEAEHPEGLPTTSLRQRRPTMRRLPEDSLDGRTQSQRLGSQDEAALDEVRVSLIENHQEQILGCV